MKTVLAFDGGGVRGAISVAFLQAIERAVGAGPDAPLARRIDLAGGTSTGAIISGALALGYSAEDIRAFYMKLAPRIFKRSRMRIPGLQSVFDAAILKREIMSICGDREMDSDDLLTGFALVMKRMDTGSAWILSNNPNSAYWNDPDDGSFLGNRHYRLTDLIRASTAAPHYFQPEAIKIVDNEAPGLFVDGGVTPHNNPSLAFLQLVALPAYGYGWPLGADNLRIVSVGTGSFRTTMDPAGASRMPAVGLAVKALSGLIADSQTQTLMLMQMLGRPLTNWTINAEVGDLGGFQLVEKPLFDYVRYDVRLEAPWLEDNLGLRLAPGEIEQLRQMDNPAMIGLAYEIGQAAAEKFVRPEHFGLSPA